MPERCAISWKLFREVEVQQLRARTAGFEVLDRAARSLGMDVPGLGTFVELADERLIGIARILGMDELAPSNEEAMKLLGLVGYVHAVEAETETETPGEVIQDKAAVRNCEICGQPYEKRNKTCSPECEVERKKRYNREYQRNYKKKLAAEVAGNESGPLASLP